MAQERGRIRTGQSDYAFRRKPVWKRVRDAITGRLVPKEEAEKRPKETVTETVKRDDSD